MPGYGGGDDRYGGRGGRDDQYGGRGGRYDSRDDRRDDRSQLRRRSRSPGRDGRDSSRGGGRGQGRDGRDRGDYNHGDYERNSRGEGRFNTSRLPLLPEAAPFPQGTGERVPYTEFIPRGTVGTRAMFYVNHFSVETLPVIKIWQYDLRFRVPEESQARGDEKVTANQMARILLNTTLVNLLGPEFVFDGVSLGWSPKEIMPEGSSLSTTISLGERPSGKPNEVEIAVGNVGLLDGNFLVNYLSEAKIDINPMGNRRLEPLQKWLNAVFRSEPAKMMISRPSSNAFFTRSTENSMTLRSTGGVLEAIRGVFQTMQIRFNRLTLNVDTATTPFWVSGKSVIDCICAMAGLRSPQGLEIYFKENPARFFQACGKLLDMFFQVKHLKPIQNAKKIKFHSWSARDAVSTIFDEQVDTKTTRSTNVVDYYWRKYSIKLQYPALPLASTRHGDFPLELCYSAPGERYKALLQGQETADFIKFATSPAYTRREQISNNLRILSWHTQPILRAHGLSVDPNMMRVKALVLPSPQVLYGNNASVQPRDGQWNLRGLQFLHPSTIRSWGMICITRRVDMLDRFGMELVKGFRAAGIFSPSRPPAILVGNPQGNMETIVSNIISKARNDFGSPPDLILVLLDSHTIPIYHALKHSLDIIQGVASQVMVAEKALKCQAQYIANIAMKVNVKLGGTNCTIEEPLFRRGRWMLIGGDTSRVKPSATQRDPPTTTALTGTFDPSCTAFTCIALMQPSTQVNLITEARPMFKELLSRYQQKNGGLMPEHIIYFRDGASESEFEAIRGREGMALRDLCKAFGTKISIVLAIKRHHTRFFAEGQFATKLGNVPTGTVVENSSTLNDAFIISHGDLQGTKRGTRYISIVDENNLSADDFNRLINNLCSTYARATRSVAVVPPIYYAHQACERANIHLQDKPDGTKFLPKVHPNLSYHMYWQ